MDSGSGICLAISALLAADLNHQMVEIGDGGIFNHTTHGSWLEFTPNDRRFRLLDVLNDIRHCLRNDRYMDLVWLPLQSGNHASHDRCHWCTTPYFLCNSTKLGVIFKNSLVGLWFFELLQIVPGTVGIVPGTVEIVPGTI